MGVTTKDLARICGVSRATVSRAIHGVGSIRPETKKMILDKAAELGYSPDHLARSLVCGKSYMIGVIVVDLRNEYFPVIVDSISQYAKKRGYLVNICTHEDDKEVEKRLIQTLKGYHVDGLILNCINKDEKFEDLLLQLDIPCIVLGYQAMSKIPTVGIDEYASARDAVQYIVKHGYKELVFVVPPLLDADGELNIGHRNRCEGVIKSAKECDINCQVIYGDDYEEQVLRYMQKKRLVKPAILCSGDMFVGEVMQTLKKNGYRNPEDYGIMGYDKTPFYQRLERPLTTVDNNGALCGYYAIKSLIDRIEGIESEKDIEVKYEIVAGETL